MEPEEEPGGAAVREVYEEVRGGGVRWFSFHTDGIWGVYRNGLLHEVQTRHFATYTQEKARRQSRSHGCFFVL